MAKKVVTEENKSSKNTTKEKTILKKPAKKEKKENALVRGTKGTISELKKVTWPSFGKVVKTTGIVISVVVIFTIVLFALDRGLSFLYDLLVKAYSA